jgi:hypothetical protein
VGGTIVKGDVLERRTRGSFGRYVGTPYFRHHAVEGYSIKSLNREMASRTKKHFPMHVTVK